MKNFNIIAILVMTMLNQNIAFADSMSCQEFVSRQEGTVIWTPGTVPIAVEHKIAFVEHAIRTKTQAAFNGMEVPRKTGKARAKLEKHLKGIDFKTLTPNNLVTIHDHIAELPYSVRKQLYLKFTGKNIEAEENLSTVRFANSLSKGGLVQFVKENGLIEDKDIRDHYRVYIKKYFPLLNFAFSTVLAVLEGFSLPAVISSFQSLFNSKDYSNGFKKLPQHVQEDIFLNGIVNAAPETREALRVHSLVTLNNHIVSHIVNTLGTLMALAFILDQLSHHYLHYTFGNVYDDIFNGQELEDAAYLAITSGLNERGVSFDETYVRAEIHKKNLAEIITEKSEH